MKRPAYTSTGLPIETKKMSQGRNDKDLPFYLAIYVGISVVICLLGTLRYFLVFLGSLKASHKLFDKLTHTILRAPLRWLDTVPIGRILNRFTADFVVVDSHLGKDLVSGTQALFIIIERSHTLRQNTCLMPQQRRVHRVLDHFAT